MNKADEIRDKLRQLRYLMDERKFIDDLLRKLEEQKNKLHLEALQIQALINEQSANRESVQPERNEPLDEEEWTGDIVTGGLNEDFLVSGTPSGPIEEPVSSLVPNLEPTNNQPKAVVETIDLDVRKVLLKLASGGHQDQEEEEEEDDD